MTTSCTCCWRAPAHVGVLADEAEVLQDHGADRAGQAVRLERAAYLGGLERRWLRDRHFDAVEPGGLDARQQRRGCAGVNSDVQMNVLTPSFIEFQCGSAALAP